MTGEFFFLMFIGGCKVNGFCVCRLDYQSGHLDSYDDTVKSGKEGKRNDGLRDWPSMLSNGSPKHSPKR